MIVRSFISFRRSSLADVESAQELSRVPDPINFSLEHNFYHTGQLGKFYHAGRLGNEHLLIHIFVLNVLGDERLHFVMG